MKSVSSMLKRYSWLPSGFSVQAFDSFLYSASEAGAATAYRAAKVSRMAAAMILYMVCFIILSVLFQYDIISIRLVRIHGFTEVVPVSGLIHTLFQCEPLVKHHFPA